MHYQIQPIVQIQGSTMHTYNQKTKLHYHHDHKDFLLWNKYFPNYPNSPNELPTTTHARLSHLNTMVSTTVHIKTTQEKTKKTKITPYTHQSQAYT